jgi:hypothetical protein
MSCVLAPLASANTIRLVVTETFFIVSSANVSAQFQGDRCGRVIPPGWKKCLLVGL